QLFGFVLIGLALYFIEPVVPGRVVERALPFYAVGAALWLGFLTAAGRDWRPFLVLRSTLGVAALAALVWLLIPRSAPASLTFERYDPALLSSAVARGTPVLMDFRADWCIPCREMDRSTFVDPTVVVAARRFVRVRADLTKNDPANQEIISKFEIQG